MSDIQASIQILQNTLPKINMQQLIDMPNPVPEFEFNCDNKWFYSVRDSADLDGGKLLDGNLICVEANSPSQAEDIAYSGLQDSIKHFCDYLSAADGEIVTEIKELH